MTQTATQRLNRIKYYDTLYELVVTMPGRQPMLAGYGRHGQAGMLRLLRANGDIWATYIADDAPVTFAKGGRSCTFGSLDFRFSGRTEREAIQAGELPFFLRVMRKEVQP